MHRGAFEAFNILRAAAYVCVVFSPELPRRDNMALWPTITRHGRWHGVTGCGPHPVVPMSGGSWVMQQNENTAMTRRREARRRRERAARASAPA